MMKRFYVGIILILFAANSYGVHNMLINGSTSANISADASFELTFTFDGSPNAKGTFYLDANGNNQLDASDPWIVKRRLIDGNFNDEDETTNGQYRELCEAFKFSGNLLFYAEDNGVSDTVVLTVDSIASNYSIAGNVNLPASRSRLLVCVIKIIDAMNMDFVIEYGNFTDNSGNYYIGLPSSYNGKWINMVVLDPAIVAPDYASNEPDIDSVLITGHNSKTLAMRSVVPDSTTLWGTLKDDANSPITDPTSITAYAYFYGTTDPIWVKLWKTDANGAYRIPLKKASFVTAWAYGVAVTSIADQFYGSYMNPIIPSANGNLNSPAQINLELKAYRPNATITGHVNKAGSNYDKCRLWTDADGIGDNFTYTYSNGNYTMPVYSGASQWYIGVHRTSIPEGFASTPLRDTVGPGATGVNFSITSGAEEGANEFKAFTTIYPNPFTSNIVFTLSGLKDVGNLMIYDIAGNCVSEIEPTTRDNNIQFILSEGLSTGVYFYSLTAGDRIFKGKLVKLQ
ncbi:MAG: T9SS type A sorting domain-containing protein [Candidatus Stahlbacteria bacterium]|nr:T9SS type A sorting domain-containing protein [Candidatus Stahlbacteria bacterium]